MDKNEMKGTGPSAPVRREPVDEWTDDRRIERRGRGDMYGMPGRREDFYGPDGRMYPPVPEEQEIDLIELAQALWKERKFLLKICGIAVLVGLVVAFSMPKEFTTTVKLAPETEDATKKMSGLGGLAAMAGINLGASAGADAISPDLYPDVVQSTPFLLELFPVEVKDKKGNFSGSLYEYMDEHQRTAWWGYIVKLPFQALGAMMSAFSDEEISSDQLNPFHLTKDQQEVLKSLQERISVSVDKKTLVITASVQMQDPVISAEMTKVVLEKLQNYITEYRTRKVKNDLVFTQKVFAEAKEAYYKAQQAYAAFEDANRNIISSSYRTEQERLKNEMTLTFNVYNTLAQKLEQDKLRVQEQTPVYTVIEPATVPLRASSPKKPLILVGFVFLALFGSIGYLFVKDMFAAEGSGKFINKDRKISPETAGNGPEAIREE